MFAPEPDPRPTRRYPDPIPMGPNRGPLPSPTPFPQRTPPIGAPDGMVTSPLAGQRQTLGGTLAQSMGGDSLFGKWRRPDGDINPGGGIDINGNDLPTTPPGDTPIDKGGGSPFPGGGEPKMPVEIPGGPPVFPPADDNPAPPDPTRWMNYGGAGGGGLSDTILAKLLEKINQGPVDPNSEDIRNIVNASRVQERRQGDRARAAMMERRAASGLTGGGGTDTGILGIEQGIGERLGGLSANLVREAQINRAQEIMQALTIGQGRIDAESSRALQAELAHLQAAIQREGMAQQQKQFEQMSELDWLRLIFGNA